MMFAPNALTTYLSRDAFSADQAKFDLHVESHDLFDPATLAALLADDTEYEAFDASNLPPMTAHVAVLTDRIALTPRLTVTHQRRVIRSGAPVHHTTHTIQEINS